MPNAVSLYPTLPGAHPGPTELTVPEVAARLHVHRSTIYRIAFFRGRIVKVNSKSIILAADVELYLSLRRTGVAARRAKAAA